MRPIDVVLDEGRLYCIGSPFHLKDALKSVGGARWAPELKAWHFPASPSCAGALERALTGHAVAWADDAGELLEQWQAERANTVRKSAENLPELPGRMPAWDHQKRGYWWAHERRGSMLAMDMGTGKSRTAISLLDGWDVQLAVVLCPKSVVGVWPNQFASHSEHEWTALASPVRGTVATRALWLTKQAGLALAQGKRVAVVVNYEAAWREPMAQMLKDLGSRHTRALILDESHRIKSSSGTTSKFAARLGERFQRVLALTGTPMPHSALDVYGQFRAFDPGIFGTSFVRFRSRYAVLGGFENRQVVGFQNMDEFTERFALGAFVVKKEEAGLDLPPTTHVDRVFDLGTKSMAAYKQLEKEMILALGAEAEHLVIADNALTKLLRLQQVTSGFVRDVDGLDHQIGKDKIELLEDVLQELDDREPVVIFARFKHDLALIREVVEKLGRRYGEVSGSCKAGHPDHGLNEHSQMREDIDVIALQLQSGGVGIDLTRSAYAIYYSVDFNLGNFEQSLARLDRPGQKRPVTYVHLVAKGTKDETVYKALSQRKDAVEAVIAESRRHDHGGRQAA